MIDEGLPNEWPEGVKEAARLLRLGHVFEIAPLFYVADTRRPIWVASRTRAQEDIERGEERGVTVIDLLPGSKSSPDKVILTSQTCDVGEETEVWEFPWVEVAPVYRIPDDDPVLNRKYVVRLTGDNLMPAGTYVADLRIEMPMEKGLLVDAPSSPGFSNEQDEIRFAEILGRRRQRPALATRINTHIRGVLRNQAHGDRPAWRRTRTEIHKVMLAIEDGPRTDPRIVRVVVISAAPLGGAARSWFERWYERARDEAATVDLVLAPMRYMDNSVFDVRAYDSLIELDISF